jgi:5-methylcytosine-specific restriction endonuclease McrA
MIETLIKNNCSFITASHFHNIASVESIKNLERLKIKHLKLTYDQKKDIIIYDRSLTDGIGEESYGLYVARYIMKDKNFNERTTEILDNYNYNNIKQSRYNSNVYIECCEICKSKEKLETHHIVWQKDFKANKNKFHLMKNNPSNLVVLCMKCHDKVDRNEITINGWDKIPVIWASAERSYQIKNNKAFIVQAEFNKEIISMAYFTDNSVICNYSSSVSLRKFFNIPVNHLVIWNAIIESKKRNCRYFCIGEEIIEKNYSEKEVSINFFKDRFYPEKKYFIDINI